MSSEPHEERLEGLWRLVGAETRLLDRRLPNDVDERAVAVLDYRHDLLAHLCGSRCAGSLLGCLSQTGDLSHGQASRPQTTLELTPARIDGDSAVGHHHVDGFSRRRDGKHFVRNDRQITTHQAGHRDGQLGPGGGVTVPPRTAHDRPSEPVTTLVLKSVSRAVTTPDSKCPTIGACTGKTELEATLRSFTPNPEAASSTALTTPSPLRRWW